MSVVKWTVLAEVDGLGKVQHTMVAGSQHSARKRLKEAYPGRKVKFLKDRQFENDS